jgi:secondary thiamine-phosphate synthase enzyme
MLYRGKLVKIKGIMNRTTLKLKAEGPGFLDFTSQVERLLQKWIQQSPLKSEGLLHLFLQHTSCALTINESYDPSAARDMERFLNHLAPENLSFIEHTDEGPDDSPSHMKALITGHSLSIPVIDGKLALGTWQGIYLCEFRDLAPERRVIVTYQGEGS